MEVANDLPRNGPSGTYSQACRSREDQSLSRNTPNTWSAKSSTDTRSPMALGVPTTKPTSASMSKRAEAPNIGTGSVGGLRWPVGRTMSVPETTMVPERP